MKSIKAKEIFIIILVAAFLAVVGFFGLRQITEPQKQELTPVSIQLRWTQWAGFSGLQVAVVKGFYEDVGIDLTFRTIDLSKPIPDLVKEVVEGRADFVEVNALEALRAYGQGADVVAVMAMLQSSPHAFASLKGSGITSPADFEGKRLGVTRDNATGNLLYPALMERVGLNPKKADIISVGIDAVSILKNGEVDVVDVFRNNQPYAFDQAGLEYNLILPENYNLGGYEEVILVSRELVDTNPELVRNFVEATILGWEYTIEHRKEALDIVVSFATDEFFKNPVFEEFALDEVMLLVQPTGGRTIGRMDFEPWFNFYNTMESQGLIEREFEVRDMYTNEFIP